MNEIELKVLNIDLRATRRKLRELGARFANVVFHEVVGELARAYEGQWQGGRVTTDGHEKQI